MKLASRKSGRDGALLVVSRDLSCAVEVGAIAATMQAALDNWQQVEAPLRAVYDALNDGCAQGAFALDQATLAAPLPRSYQYLDGACYLSHIRRNRAARGDSLPDDILEAPLVYQGISHGFMAWNDPIRLPSESLGIDFEAEIAAVTGDVPLGVSADEATQYVRLFVEGDVLKNAILIPQKCVVMTQKGAVVMGLDKEDKVYPIPITVTVAVGDKYLVGSGLKGGERIISEGIIKARPGTQVRVQQAGGQQPQDAAPKK